MGFQRVRHDWVTECVWHTHTHARTQTPEFLKSSILESHAIVSEISPLCSEGTRVLSRETEAEGISWGWSLAGLRRLRLCWEHAGECLLPEALGAWRVIIIPPAWLGFGRDGQGQGSAMAGLAGCYVLNACVPPKFICWNPAPKVMPLGGGAFGRWLGHGGGAFMNGISALIKAAQERSLASYTMWEYTEKLAVGNLEEGLPQSPTTRLALWSWTSSLWSCEQ